MGVSSSNLRLANWVGRLALDLFDPGQTRAVALAGRLDGAAEV